MLEEEKQKNTWLSIHLNNDRPLNYAVKYVALSVAIVYEDIYIYIYIYIYIKVTERV